MKQLLTCLLLAPLAWLCGCGSPDLPPGGKPAVEYWRRVLTQHPDLPAKVEAIVESRGWAPWQNYELPATEVRIYSEQGEVSLSGSKIELIVTDLDTPALRELLAVWKAIPEQAAELGLFAETYNAASSRRKIIVLGSEGRVDIRAADDYTSQTIQVLADEAAAQTRIGIHTFGASGEQALEELSRCYQAVRGPPSEDVRSGYVSLPPPEDTLSVLVIGRLQELNIDGAGGNSAQDISVASYFNGHHAAEDLSGRPAGSPFAERIAMQSTAARQAESAATGPAAAVPAAESAAPADYASPGHAGSNFTPPLVPVPIQMPPTFQPPTFTPPNTFHPPVYVPPPVFHPATPFTPTVRFR